MRFPLSILAILALPVFAGPISITEDDCPSQLLDINDGQLLCMDTSDPAPDPDPIPDPEPGAACPIQPNLYNSGIVITGGPFNDCGELTTLRSPNPTVTYWHIMGRGWEGISLCAMPGSWQQELWRYPGGNVTIENHDMRILIGDTTPGDLIVEGSRLKIDMIHGAYVSGDFICGPNAHNVELNGECVCP